MFEASCPRCGKAFYRPDYRVDAGKWYLLAAMRAYCPWCKVELTLSRTSRRLSGAHLWPFPFAALFGVFTPDKNLSGDVLWVGIALMLAARMVFLLNRTYVVVEKPL